MEIQINDKVKLSKKGKYLQGSLPKVMTIKLISKSGFYCIKENNCASLHGTYLIKILAENGKRK